MGRVKHPIRDGKCVNPSIWQTVSLLAILIDVFVKLRCTVCDRSREKFRSMVSGTRLRAPETAIVLQHLHPLRLTSGERNTMGAFVLSSVEIIVEL